MTSSKGMESLVQHLQFSAEEQQLFLAKLWELLKLQAAKYGGTDSTSLPAEKVQELLSSLVYTLSVAASADGLSAERLLHSDFPLLLRRGQAVLDGMRKAQHRTWNDLCLTVPDLYNAYFVDTIQNLGLFFKRYDLYYAADQIPCSIDYPLLCPVPEERRGVHFIEAYLRELRFENAFLRCFDPETVKALLRSMHPGYEEDYLNLCEPVLIHALGRTLLGREPYPLSLSPEDLPRLEALLEGRTEELFTALFRAAEALCRTLGFGAGEASCFAQALRSLSVRVELAAGAGNLANIFCPGGLPFSR